MVNNQQLIKKFILKLTSFGWKYEVNKGLYWGYKVGDTFLSPNIVQKIQSDNLTLYNFLLQSGWILVGSGYNLSYKSYSPYLPLTPIDIVKDCKKSINAGAAVVHLHTRNLSKEFVKIPGISSKIDISLQSNFIDIKQYDFISEQLLSYNQNVILNFSTSIRGSGIPADSELRRKHLKEYGINGIRPDLASFSPGIVYFKNEDNYDNPKQFLNEQLKFLKHNNIT